MNSQEFSRNVRPSVLSNKNFNKIFLLLVITRRGLLQWNGFYACTGIQCHNNRNREARLTKQVFRTNYDEFVSFVRRYDAFQDLPFLRNRHTWWLTHFSQILSLF